MTLWDNTVLATGGGVVLRAENRRALGSRGYVIYLYASVEEQVKRTRRDRKRPLLQQGNPRETLARLQKEREPLYREIADYRFVTDRQGPKALARQIEEKLKEDGLL